MSGFLQRTYRLSQDIKFTLLALVMDSVRNCPLCSSAVCLYSIDFNRRFYMCENRECSYPFGSSDFGDLITTDSSETNGSEVETINVIDDSQPNDIIADMTATTSPESLQPITPKEYTNSPSFGTDIPILDGDLSVNIDLLTLLGVTPVPDSVEESSESCVKLFDESFLKEFGINLLEPDQQAHFIEGHEGTLFVSEDQRKMQEGSIIESFDFSVDNMNMNTEDESVSLELP
ncbi:2235_t:CDS:2 [Paraglomus occultum]|uniref:2235_t:CDS:1 n=1 Tax=Paraglomus occultum TaxID=144539 RepID=A0A9N9GRJ2_9GLOM|nr:2235_t:CDS:2 [Paraglomus occultum]